MRGKKRPPEERVSNVTGPLPPCKVCGEPAAGFHYGVNTCEACKGFFRRSLVRNGEYRCQGAGNCPIGANRRKSCPKCRYIKCLNVGMSKEAIKTGRYTYQKRTQDTLEIKMIERVTLETGLEPTQLADMGDPASLLRYTGTITNSKVINTTITRNDFSITNDDSRSISRNSFSNNFEGNNFIAFNGVCTTPRNNATPYSPQESFSRNDFPALPPSGNSRVNISMRNASFESDVQQSTSMPTHPPYFASTPVQSPKLSHTAYHDPLNAPNVFPSVPSPNLTELTVLPKTICRLSSESSAPNGHAFSFCKSLESAQTFVPENNAPRVSIHVKDPGCGNGFREQNCCDKSLPYNRDIFVSSRALISPASQSNFGFNSLNNTDSAAQRTHLNSHLEQSQHQDTLRQTQNSHSFSPMHRGQALSHKLRCHCPGGKTTSLTEVDVHSKSMPDTYHPQSGSVTACSPTFTCKGVEGGGLTRGDKPPQYNTNLQQPSYELRQQQVHHITSDHKEDDQKTFHDLTDQHQPQSFQRHGTLDQDGESDLYAQTNLPKFGNQTSPVYSSMFTPESLAESVSPDGNSSMDNIDLSNTTSQNSPSRCSTGVSMPEDFSISCFKLKQHRHGCEMVQERRPYVYPLEITRVLNTPGVTTPMRVENNQVCKYPPSIHIERLPTFDPLTCSNYTEDFNEISRRSMKPVSKSEANHMKGVAENPPIDDFSRRPHIRHGYYSCSLHRLEPPTSSMFRDETLAKVPPRNKILSIYSPNSPVRDLKDESSCCQSKDTVKAKTLTHHQQLHAGHCNKTNEHISNFCQTGHLTNSNCSKNLSFEPENERYSKKEQSSANVLLDLHHNAVKKSTPTSSISQQHTTRHNPCLQHYNKTFESSNSSHLPSPEISANSSNAQGKQTRSQYPEGSSNQSPSPPEPAVATLSPLSAEASLPPLQVWNPIVSVKMSEVEMDKIIADLVDSHRRLIYDTNSLSDAFFESKISECKERCTLQDEIFGHMGIVGWEEHQRIYNTTGLDVDNRLESLDHVAELMDADIRHIIAFLKTIPGFRSFSLADQTALVKAAMSELFFMAYYRGYFIDHYIVVEATNTYCIHNMALVYPPIFLTKLFAVAGAFRDLKLSFNATVALKALSVFFPDRASILNRYQCEVLFDKYLQCFLHQLKRDFPDSHGRVMARLASQLAELRELQHICHQLWRTEFYQYQAVANRPILMELFTNNY